MSFVAIGIGLTAAGSIYGGIAQNKLRKKMAKQAEDIFTSGRHKGSQAGDYIDKGMSKMDSKATVKLSQDLTGTKKKKKTGPGAR